MTNAAFTGDEIISDILLSFSEAHEILASHGIACAGCHINQYETLREGVSAHYSPDLFNRVLADLNEAAAETGELNLVRLPDPIITPSARDKLLEFQVAEDKKGYGLKVEAIDNLGEPNYFLDLQKKPDSGDRVFQSEGIHIFCNLESEKILRGKQINYVITDEDEGFKFESQ